MVTVTPGITAPLPSTTLPKISPVLTCAASGLAGSIARHASTPSRHIRVMSPPKIEEERKGVLRANQDLCRHLPRDQGGYRTADGAIEGRNLLFHQALVVPFRRVE